MKSTFRVFEQIVGHLVRGIGDDLQRPRWHPGGFGRRAEDLQAAFAATDRNR